MANQRARLAALVAGGPAALAAFPRIPARDDAELAFAVALRLCSDPATALPGLFFLGLAAGRGSIDAHLHLAQLRLDPADFPRWAAGVRLRLEPLARGGHAGAAALLARVLREGRVVPRDDAAAAAWEARFPAAQQAEALREVEARCARLRGDGRV
jgi:hypothetical protein